MTDASNLRGAPGASGAAGAAGASGATAAPAPLDARHRAAVALLADLIIPPSADGRLPGASA
ncbi:MAG TPA: RND transporter, partial [Quisquiliibacterium sp.]|nr:RND transporter [Quisquiliibacterium sp.]